jgi:hypothetical protein
LTLIAHEIDNIFTPELMDGFISNGSLPQGLDVEVRKVLGAIDNKSGNYGEYKAPSDKDLSLYLQPSSCNHWKPLINIIAHFGIG